MKRVFDTTITVLTAKLDKDIHGLTAAYETKISEQKMIIAVFEKKFSLTIANRMERLEQFVEHIATE